MFEVVVGCVMSHKTLIYFKISLWYFGNVITILTFLTGFFFVMLITCHPFY